MLMHIRYNAFDTQESRNRVWNLINYSGQFFKFQSCLYEARHECACIQGVPFNACTPTTVRMNRAHREPLQITLPYRWVLWRNPRKHVLIVPKSFNVHQILLRSSSWCIRILSRYILHSLQPNVQNTPSHLRNKIRQHICALHVMHNQGSGNVLVAIKYFDICPCKFHMACDISMVACSTFLLPIVQLSP